MSDIGDSFREMRKEGQQRRAGNRASGRAALDAAGIAYESKNNGAHLILAGIVDYWPGTGLWRVRNMNKSGRGIKALLNFMQSNPTTAGTVKEPK